MEQRGPQQVEQFEIIERTVTESHRPLTSAEALVFQPQSSVRTSTEQFVFTGNSSGSSAGFVEGHPAADRRFQLTSERDVGHDASLLYTPFTGGGGGLGQQQPSFLRELPLHQSTPERHQTSTTTAINQYGYDLHEVQTSEGGARVVETHGAGHLMLDRSLTAAEANGIDQLQRVTPPEPRLPPPSILKQQQPYGGIGAMAGEADTSWRKSPSSESSIQRKNSYKRMQDEQEAAAAAAIAHQQQRDSLYGQSTNATIISKQSSKASGMPGWTKSWFHHGSGAGKLDASADSSMARLKDSIADLSRQLREGECSPRLVLALALVGLFLLLLLFLLWLLISSLFLHRSSYTFWLYPPVCEECQRRGARAYRPPSTLYVNLYSPAQVHFELVGQQPFKSNSFTAVDFDTGFIAIADHALTNEQGRHTSCFLMELDRTALPAMDVLVDALKNTYEEVHAQFGWQEYWQFNTEQVDASYAHNKFRDPVEDCQGVQWYLLKHTVYTKDESCSYCYDFCLPDYAVLRRQKYEDETSLGIRRLNCFRLYVPEWSRYQFVTDASGGHFAYPKYGAAASAQQNAQQQQRQPDSSNSNFSQQQQRRRRRR